MGVRVRVRRQSGSRARGTTPSTALPELSRPQPSPSRRSALAAGSGGLAPAAYRAGWDVTPWPPKRLRRVPSLGRSPCASSAPKRCAPSCSPAPPSPAGQAAAPAARGPTPQRRCSTARPGAPSTSRRAPAGSGSPGRPPWWGRRPDRTELHGKRSGFSRCWRGGVTSVQPKDV